MNRDHWADVCKRALSNLDTASLTETVAVVSIRDSNGVRSSKLIELERLDAMSEEQVEKELRGAWEQKLLAQVHRDLAARVAVAQLPNGGYQGCTWFDRLNDFILGEERKTLAEALEATPDP